MSTDLVHVVLEVALPQGVSDIINTRFQKIGLGEREVKVGGRVDGPQDLGYLCSLIVYIHLGF